MGKREVSFFGLKIVNGFNTINSFKVPSACLVQCLVTILVSIYLK